MIANIARDGDTLILRRAHIDGPGPATMGIRELYEFGRAFAKQQGFKQLMVEPARRSTGLMKGRVPRPIIIKVE